MDDKLPPRAAVLGHDLGSQYSKLALAFTEPPHTTPRLLRVKFSGTLKDPDKPRGYTDSNYEFFASAAIDNVGSLVEGKGALAYDLCIPLKTMLLYLALVSLRHCEKVVRLMPMGTLLLDAIAASEITPQMMRDGLVKHLTRLRRMVQVATEDNNLEVAMLAITYPNYLIPNESSKDFDLYVNLYTELLTVVWGNIKFRIISEGQAAATYICTPLQDLESGAQKQQVGRLFNGLNKETWITLWIFDHGGSSVNLQSICVRFDSEGNVRHSQSFVRPGQTAGVQGGSHVANDEVRKFLISHLDMLRKTGIPIQEGDLAKYMQSFDYQKTKQDFNYKDYIEGKKTLSLVIDGGVQLAVRMPPSDVKKAFKSAFDKGLALLTEEVQHALKDTNDVALLFTGGSYMSLGLREDIEDTLLGFESQLHAGKLKIKFNYDFMENLRLDCSSAVCAGAALGLATIPPLAKTLPGFTLGIQVVRKVGEGKDIYWEPSNTVKTLISEGAGAGGAPRFVDHVISSQAAKFKALIFHVVCDPFYHAGRTPQTVSKFHPIQIYPVRKLPKDKNPLGPYELGCSLEAADLPTGIVRFSFTGKRLQHLMCGRLEEAVAPDMDALPIILNCHGVTKKGEKRRDQGDKKFVLWIKADPASRFPIVGQEKDFKEFTLPVWCRSCKGEIETEIGWRCPDCSYGYCSTCTPGATHSRGCSGRFDRVEMNP